MKRNSPVFKILVNSLVGLALLFGWSRLVDIHEIIEVLKTVNPAVVVVAVLFIILPGAIRALRLKLFLKDYKIRLTDLIFLNYLSQLLSFMIPIRAGELTKSVYLTTQYQLPLAKTVIWIFLDRFIDFWVTLLLIITFLMLTPTVIPDNLVRLTFGLFIGFSLAAIVIILSESLAKKVIKLVSGLIPHPKLKSFFERFTLNIVDGFSVLKKSPTSLALLFGLTVAAILSDAMFLVVIFRSLNIQMEFLQIFLGNLLFSLSFIVPAAPGYVGSVEAAGMGVFSGILGLDKTIASAAMVLFHIVTIATLPILGLTGLYFLKFDLGLVWKKLRNK